MMGACRDLRWLAAAPLLLGGLLPLDSRVSSHWWVAGRWAFPVGDPLAIGAAGPHGEPPYQVTRNLGAASGERHDGADLSNRTAGDTVRAAANGIVITAHDAGNGYGFHVVLGHRCLDGSLVLSVYAHLAARSLRVEAGQPVRMGQALGRVGRTGVATSPHLHFEIRRPATWDERWEKTKTLDPVQFVGAGLPTRQNDSTWAQPYLEWAESAGLIEPGEDRDQSVSRERWWKVLALARTRDPGLLDQPPPPQGSDATGQLPWRELVRDLKRAREVGLCLPRAAVDPRRRRADCARQFGTPRPLRHSRSLLTRRAQCTIADLALLMSEAAEP